jgi:hypothetical protein
MNSNRQWAMDKKLTTEYQALSEDNPAKKEIDYTARTGKFVE